MRKNGFTLIQLIIACVLIAIVAGFFSFRFSGYIGSVKLKSTALTIASDLRAAKMRAFSEHKGQSIIFSTDQYNIGGKIKKLPAQVVITNPQTVKFADSGMPTVGFFGTVMLKCNGKTSSIVISSIGRIRIE